MSPTQLDLPFDELFEAGDNPALWTPRELWVKLSAPLLAHFAEDRRIEYKRADKIHFDEAATYFSAFSNTPEGGVLVFGADSRGNATGASGTSSKQLNRLENFHLELCPQAKPEFKKIATVIDNRPDFVIAIYIPYVGRLVETNKGEAWIRYGDSRHRMSEEEKRDFRSTRQELAFELEPAPYSYPADFDLQIINDFCAEFRRREGRRWSNEEVLADRHLGRIDRHGFTPFNNLVLLSGKDPRRSIPGCRVRVQRFASSEEGSGHSYNPIRDKFVEGNVVKLIKEAAQVMEELSFDVTWLNKDGKFVTTPEYPRWAWFEALVNACVHRSYSYSGTEITVKFFSDRLEVESPGGFVPPVNENTIYFTRAARNHHFMDALRYLGYVQMAREGTRRIRDSMKEYRLPDPVFRQEALHGVVVKVTLRNDHETRKRSTDRDVAQFFGVDVWRSLQEHEIKIAAHAFHNETIQVSEAQRISGRTWSTSKKDLDRLVRKGVLEFVPGQFQRDPSAHYRLIKSKEH